MKHGGKRKGAGRPAQEAIGDVKRHQVMLDATTVKKARELGDGELSLGIRRKFKN